MSHFLKRLELNGFKSFAGKTVLEFPAGIVGVVGPNGSGKSNLVDAVRWLLGERDAKNLRGGKAEDLIFAGTEKRARVGMASASLYFENRNKFFPVDFEEVVVTRQTSRGGENKYFLNRSEILLRDLIDFLAKARLGSRGLIIIGQGDSDLFIRSSPRDRREMIEEILGLREYQLKKADAERRLKNSRINLDKTHALIEEILPHLRSLKRQTGRWERRGALEEELRALEDRFFGSHLRELRERSAEAEKKIAVHGVQFDALRKKLAAAEARQAEIEASQPEEKKGLAKIKGEIGALIETRSTLQKDLGRLEAQIELAQSSPSSGATPEGHSAERLLALLKTVQQELQRALDENALELHATVENILEEIEVTLHERQRKKLVAVVEDDGDGNAAGARAGAAAQAELAQRLKKIMRDLSEMERQIVALREKEGSFEQSQEGFYKNFKSAVAEVQTAKGAIAEWEDRNREHTLERERLDLRREELHRQIAQSGRKPGDFEVAAGTDGGNDAKSPRALTSAVEFQEAERAMFRLRGELASMGVVDAALMKEATETEARYEFLKKESEDLEKAVADLTRLMHELAEKIKTEFEKSLHKINAEFEKFFELMFGGGSAKLKVQKPSADAKAEDDEHASAVVDAGANGDAAQTQVEAEAAETAGGVEIEVKLPRKKAASLDALSGGERSLVGIAALFAMVSVSPPPFLMLDEIDAPLDERNARRFGEMLKEFSKRTQFIVVTHNRATMEAADILYGVTLDADGTSKIVSIKLESSETATA